MTNVEILAPAGAQAQLLAAVRCGANAVYLGARGFNARRNAANFGEAELSDAVAYAHARGVRVYVTVNTLVLDTEMPALEAVAEEIAQAGADAVIIQDMAVLKLFAGRYPALKRYASTQTAVHNVDGARFLQDMGFESLVLARELTLAEMARICAAVPLRAEAFIHGAHCMSVSGACYLSAMLGGRSGNRGLCAQPCRLNWRCGEKNCALSLKDMSLIPHIREMADAGVETFKIEGRMKRPEYVAAAVCACKSALAGEPYDAETLRAVFSRSGFTDGYLTGRRDADMFGYRTREDVAGAEGVLKALAALYRNETPLVPVAMRFALTPEQSRLTVCDAAREISVTGPAPEKALHRALDAQAAEKNLAKTGGTPFYAQSFSAQIAPGLMQSAAALNALRRQALDELLALRGQTPPIPREAYTVPAPARYTSPRETPALWARFYDEAQLADVDATAFERLLLPVERVTPALLARFGDKLAAQLPTALFPEDEPALATRLGALRADGLAAVWANNIYGVALGKRLGLAVHGGFGLNVANTEALAAYEAQGLASLTLSFELSMAALRALGGTLPRGALAYGYLPLMHFRACPLRAHIGCAACGGAGKLTDRLGIDFPVECGERRYSMLLNSVPLDVAEQNLRGLDYALLYFTRESARTVRETAARFARGEKTNGPHTGGLYYRELL